MYRRLLGNEFIKVLRLVGNRMRLYIFCAFLNAFLGAVCFNTVLAFIGRDVFNGAVYGDMSLVVRSIVIAGISFVIGTALAPAAAFTASKCARQTVTGIRTKVFKHLCDSAVPDLEHHHSGDLISRVTNDLDSLAGIYSSQIPALLFTLILGIVSIASIFILEWKLGIIVMILGTITILISRRFAKKTRIISDTVQEQTGRMNEKLVDLLQGIPAARIFHLENMLHGLYSHINSSMSDNVFKRDCTTARFSSIDYLLSYINTIGLLCLGVFMYTQGLVDMGTIVAVILLQGNASFMFKNINSFIIETQKSLAGAKRIFEVLQYKTEDDGRTAPVMNNGTKKSPEYLIELKGIGFSYDSTGNESSVSLLNNINISVKKGQLAALSGFSGCGKSTIIKLLLGFYKAKCGNIHISGKPIDSYSLSELRDMTAYVPQSTYLFDGTIAENISYGKPGASMDEIIKAAKAANAHSFIVEFEDGYETYVKERGERLSGGQRQRIALARAFLKDASILLLDEATSALDPESERLVEQSLHMLMKGRTTIAVAHSPSLIEHADVVYNIG